MTGETRDLLLAALDARGAGETVSQVASASGGSISPAWRLSLSSGQELFAKTGPSSAGEMFDSEVRGLEAIRNVGVLRVPSEPSLFESRAGAVIVMEAIALGPEEGGFQREFGATLARHHRASTTERCGFEQSNFIGATPQPNPWTSDWIGFVKRHRLGYQLELATSRGLADSRLESAVEELIANLPELLEGGSNEPMCLLHGDLWAGNYLVSEQGRAVVIDPACYCGHREADLAMTHLFGGFSSDFYAGYESEWPLLAGSARRQEIYKLYHLLNHLNLFGGSYLDQSISLARGLI